ncbi:uncharacterized protein BXIN_2636 [Babesia sp. Xinjiang]|uniref:uncharacterized protein n=1 Tax=Babesia sp. Xinjiang TaxID=462227 RepID=UPI000A224AF5|nr:uncharacterized protein BXIN_2684 [Babesia sp. Xinjiang]XP_028872111.1 uncharacterized protein BXIN_2636 [Babesia sp. Xinjiang]ORM41620.1 hypothetical protein BXIN_2684 [Babesia sp. Xinjiang]ORM41655.1 hypothetical protein BXIN_2636 [Babesia sp. Xinjiang]
MEGQASDEHIDFNEEWLDCLRANELGEAVDLLKQRLVTNLNVLDINGNGALHYCCANNLTEAMAFLLKECKLDYCSPNRSGNTPLQWAVQTNSTDAVKQLLLHDYNVHKEEYEMQEGSEYYSTLEPVEVRDEFKLDEDTKRYYNILEYAVTYPENSRISIVTPNKFGKTILADAFNAKDQNILHALLEHPAASVLDQPPDTTEPEVPVERVVVNGVNGVVHSFQFGAEAEGNGQPVVKARELEIKNDQILNANTAEMDHTGEVIWETDLVAAQWLSSLARHGKFQGKSVIQLGSGCGLSAIAMYINASVCGKTPKSLMFTDVCEWTIANLRFNVELNNLNAIDGVDIRSLDWTKQHTWPRDMNGAIQTFDIVIGSDLVYDAKLVSPLTVVVQALLDKQYGELFYAFRQARQGSDLFPEA